MNNIKRIEALNNLINKPEVTNGFKTRQDCILWGNQITQLLNFDNELQDSFVYQLSFINIVGLSRDLHASALHNMVTIVYKAISKLEIISDDARTSTKDNYILPPPPSVTLEWLWRNVPFKYWLLFIGFLVSAFGLGITFSETNLYKSLTKAQTANTTAPIKIAPTKQ